MIEEKPFNQIEGISYPNPNYNQQTKSEQDGVNLPFNENTHKSMLNKTADTLWGLNSQIEELEEKVDDLNLILRKAVISGKYSKISKDIMKLDLLRFEAKLQTLKSNKKLFEDAFEKLKEELKYEMITKEEKQNVISAIKFWLIIFMTWFWIAIIYRLAEQKLSLTTLNIFLGFLIIGVLVCLLFYWEKRI